MYWDNGKENGNYHLGFWVSVWIIQGLYRGHTGIMKKKMETTGIIRIIWGFWGILGLYWDTGKENENYCSRPCLNYRSHVPLQQLLALGALTDPGHRGE